MRRSRLAADDGFTLVELLVVILIIGLLAAIALPVFLGQRSKAQDTEAKSAVSTAAKAMETWSTENGSYASATTTGLIKIEASLGAARGLSVTSTARSFTVTVDSLGDGGTFSLTRADDGSVVRDCSNPGAGMCADQPDAQGNRW